MNRSRNGALALIVVLAVLLGRNGLETAGAQATAVADALATGQVIPTGVIPPSKLDDLLTATVGRVRPEMVSKHGNFEAYWKAARSSREGKAFEAIVSDTVNRRNLATGVGRRLYTSASLGFPTSACDLVEVDEAGRVLRRIQLKLGLQGTLDALTDAKYAGMDILTDQDTLDALRQRLARAQLKGKTLKPELKALEEALDSGRLLSRLPCGAPLPRRAWISKTTLDHARRLWKQAAKLLAKAGQTAAGKAVKATGRAVGKAAGVVLKAVPPAAIGYELYTRGKEAQETERRFARGEISQQEREVDHSRTTGKAVGGAVGALVGVKAGAVAGAALGSIAGPVGAAVGGVVGGLGGAIGGALGGEIVVGKAAAALTRSAHRAGTTVKDTAGRAGRSVGNAAGAAWKWVRGD